MQKIRMILAGLLFAFLAGSGFPALAADNADAEAIAALMKAQFEKPDAPLSVEPVTVAGDVAVAGWSQGDMGGRALLRRKQGKWVLTLCSGDALKDPQSLRQFGLSADQASAMAARVAAAEAAIDPQMAAKFSSFEGLVRMDGSGAQ